MEDQIEIEQWAIVELMGRKVVAGKISKSELLGKPLLRVDVPAIGNIPEFTQMFGESAIYCVTFVSEQQARRTAEVTRNKPILVYDVRQLEDHDQENF